MPKVTYLADQSFSPDSINLSCSEANITFNARIPVELTDREVSAFMRDSQVFLDTYNAGTIVIQDYKEPSEEEVLKAKVDVLETIKQTITLDSLLSQIDFEVRKKLVDKISEAVADEVLPKIFKVFSQNTSEKPKEETEIVEAPITATTPPESTTKKTVKP
jgi:hypothetical protein